MKFASKLFVLGGIGAAAYGAARLLRSTAQQARRRSDIDSLFDASDVHDISEIGDTFDIDEPIIVTEEVVVISDDADLELIPTETDER